MFTLVAFCFALNSLAQAPRQKIYLFLTEPLREETVRINLENEIGEEQQINTEKPVDLVPSSDFKVTYISNKHTKKTLSLELAKSGLVKLEVYDFYGKHLGTLFEGYSDKQQLIIEEDESWKTFTQFKGVTFFLLTIDGEVVLKKLLPKVD
jgi:hypothetical protein